MRIHQPFFYERINLLNAAERQTLLNHMKDTQPHLFTTNAIDVEISEEGFNALRERIKEFEPEQDDFDFDKIHPVETNEIEFEHYMTLMHMSSLTLGEGGNYDVLDVMDSIMETYETLYNQIVQEHENGDRQVSYVISGNRVLTLEEDLAGLEKAFKRRMDDLSGYITCRQTMGGAWLARRNSRPSQQSLQNQQSTQNRVKRYDGYYYSEKEYVDVAVAMMKQAHEKFLVLLDSKNYQKGNGKRIISDIINENAYFLADTKKLYSKY